MAAATPFRDVTSAMSFCARGWGMAIHQGTTGGIEGNDWWWRLTPTQRGPSILGNKATHLRRVPLHAFCLAERIFKPAEMILATCHWRNGAFLKNTTSRATDSFTISACCGVQSGSSIGFWALGFLCPGTLLEPTVHTSGGLLPLGNRLTGNYEFFGFLIEVGQVS